jgi:hypothetical protein
MSRYFQINPSLQLSKVSVCSFVCLSDSEVFPADSAWAFGTWLSFSTFLFFHSGVMQKIGLSPKMIKN